MSAMTFTAAGLFMAGLLITAINVYLSWIRMPLLRRVRNTDAVSWVSGIPVIGSAALWLSAALLPAGHGFTPVALGASLLDTGGIHWFVGNAVWWFLRTRRRKRTNPEDLE